MTTDSTQIVIDHVMREAHITEANFLFLYILFLDVYNKTVVLKVPLLKFYIRAYASFLSSIHFPMTTEKYHYVDCASSTVNYIFLMT